MKWDDAAQNGLHDMLQSGLTRKQAAENLGVKPQSIDAAIRRFPDKLSKFKASTISFTEQQLQAALDEAKTISGAAKILGCTDSTARAWIVKFGLKKPNNNGNKKSTETPQVALQIAKLQKTGASYDEIASKVGVHEGTIRYYINRYSDIMVVRQNKRPVHYGRLKPVCQPHEVEQPPKPIPLPQGVKRIPWVDLARNQCQWSLGDFFDPVSNEFECCGNDTERGKRFCNHHLKYMKKGWDNG